MSETIVDPAHEDRRLRLAQAAEGRFWPQPFRVQIATGPGGEIILTVPKTDQHRMLSLVMESCDVSYVRGAGPDGWSLIFQEHKRAQIREALNGWNSFLKDYQDLRL